MVTTGEMASSQNAQVALLHRISNIVSSDQDIEAILQEMVSLAMNVTHSDACLVYLIDHATNEIVLRASQLPHDGEIGRVRGIRFNACAIYTTNNHLYGMARMFAALVGNRFAAMHVFRTLDNARKWLDSFPMPVG